MAENAQLELEQYAREEGARAADGVLSTITLLPAVADRAAALKEVLWRLGGNVDSATTVLVGRHIAQGADPSVAMRAALVEAFTAYLLERASQVGLGAISASFAGSAANVMNIITQGVGAVTQLAGVVTSTYSTIKGTTSQTQALNAAVAAKQQELAAQQAARQAAVASRPPAPPSTSVRVPASGAGAQAPLAPAPQALVSGGIKPWMIGAGFAGLVGVGLLIWAVKK